MRSSISEKQCLASDVEHKGLPASPPQSREAPVDVQQSWVASLGLPPNLTHNGRDIVCSPDRHPLVYHPCDTPYTGVEKRTEWVERTAHGVNWSEDGRVGADVRVDEAQETIVTPVAEVRKKNVESRQRPDITAVPEQLGPSITPPTGQRTPFEYVYQDVVDPDFGEKVTLHYKVSLIQDGYRRNKYGAAIADTWKHRSTPEEARLKWRQRVAESEAQLEVYSDSE